MARTGVAAGRRLLAQKSIATVVDHLVYGRHDRLWRGRKHTAFTKAADALEAAGLVRFDPDHRFPSSAQLTGLGRDLYFGGRPDGWVLFDWAVVASRSERTPTLCGYRAATVTAEGLYSVPLTPTAAPWVDWCRRVYARHPCVVGRALTFVTGAPPDVLAYGTDVRRHATIIAEILPATLRISRRHGLPRWGVVCVPILAPGGGAAVVVRGDTAIVADLDLVLHHRRAVTTMLDVADL